jgi:hypothetical protein
MTPNAFIGKIEKPWSAEITKALGPSAEIGSSWWIWLAREQGVVLEEWKCISPKYGWPLRLILKKRYRAPFYLRRIFPRGLYPR